MPCDQSYDADVIKPRAHGFNHANGFPCPETDGGKCAASQPSGANLSAKSTSGFNVSCTGATDAFYWIVIGNPSYRNALR